MLKIQTKTLSLRYHPKEDRMKLVITTHDNDHIEFWITRRFYLSTLFELDTYLESIGMDNNTLTTKREKKQEQNLSNDKESSLTNSTQESYLLHNIKLKIGEKRKRFFISFYSGSFECETIMTTDTFLDFYAMMKNTFPKNEWGII